MFIVMVPFELLQSISLSCFIIRELNLHSARDLRKSVLVTKSKLMVILQLQKEQQLPPHRQIYDNLRE